MSTWWSAHTHSRYSAKDAMPSVTELVDKAVELGYPALGLTDHGNMAGTVELYKACKKAGIKPLPGIEAYMTFDRSRLVDKRPKTQHLGMLAVSGKGYRNLVHVNNMMHRNYKFKAVVDFADLAELHEEGLLEDIACLSGCHFGLLSVMTREWQGGIDAARNVMTSLHTWFGAGLYLETQNHNVADRLDQEAAFCEWILQRSQEWGIPTIITQDAHYIDHADQPLHDFFKTMMSWSDEPDDAVFPGDGYHLADAAWIHAHHPQHILEAGLAGLQDLYDKADVVIDELERFSLNVPALPGVQDPSEHMRQQCKDRLDYLIDLEVLPRGKRHLYYTRLDEELDIIIGSDFSGYLLFTQMICDWLREHNILFEARGSASGSLVCWLLGITTWDPIHWGLQFGRFLSKDRTKPPDVDIDIEHVRREEVIDWLSRDYTAVRIGTWNELSARGEETEYEEVLNPRGSIMRMYASMKRKQGEPIDDERIDNATWANINALSRMKTLSNYGVNAAGLLVAPDEHSISAVPLMWVASSKTMVTALDKNDVEALGMLKVDLLGSKTLSAVREIERATGITRDMIKLNDRATFTAIGQGHVHGCFQLEGKATKAGLKKLKPTHIRDIIAAMALFRPAPMNSGATESYIARKHGQEKMPDRHPILVEATRNTYGVLLFQEQVLNIMRALGLGPEDLNRFLKAIKASNSDIGDAGNVIKGYHDELARLAKDADMSNADFAWLWSQTVEFAGYSFNMAHSTAYGILAYQTAWYRTHYPAEFWAAMLNAYSSATSKSSNPKQELSYTRAARESGVKILPAHVNKSGVGYTRDGDKIRKGLVSLDNVGPKAAREIAAHAPYTSIMDLVARTNNSVVTGCKALKEGRTPDKASGVIAALWAANALEDLIIDVPEPKKTKKKETIDNVRLI